MRTLWTHWLGRVAGAGLAAALLASPAWSQVPGAAEPLKEATQPAADAAKQAAPKAGSSVKETADDLRGAAQDAGGKARDASKGAAGKARDAGQRVEDAAKGAADDARRGADDAVKGARREGREALREGREGVREGRESLREDGRLTGDNLRPADLGLWFDADASAEGLVIADIAAEGAIAKVGFQEGDRIVSINGTPVRSDAEFTRLLLADDIRNERVKVVVFRGGREQIVYVQPALLYQEVVAYDPLWQYGLVIDDRYNDRIVIQRVYPRTPAYYAGQRAGDVVTSLGGRRIATLADFTRALSSADGRLALQVNRANRTRQIALDTSSVTEGRARTTLRPEVGAEGRINGRTEGPLEGGAKARIEERNKGRVSDPSKERDYEATPRPRLDPKGDRPGADTPRADAPRPGAPRSDAPRTDAPRPGAPRGEKPGVEIPDVPDAAPKTPGTPKTPKVPSVPKL